MNTTPMGTHSFEVGNSFYVCMDLLDYSASDVSRIYALSILTDRPLTLVGADFCQVFLGRDSTSICLSLFTCYRECRYATTTATTSSDESGRRAQRLAQRILIIYLMYRSRDLDTTSTTLAGGTPELILHPFLYLFLRLHSHHTQPPPPPSDGLLLLPLLCHHPLFPSSPTSLEEQHFLSHILGATQPELRQLFDHRSALQIVIAYSNGSSPPREPNLSRHVQMVEGQLRRYSTSLIGRSGREVDFANDRVALLIYRLVPPPLLRMEASVGVGGVEATATPVVVEDQPTSIPSISSSSTSPPAAFSRTYIIDCLKRIASGTGTQLSRADAAKVAAAVVEEPSLFDELQLEDDFPKFVEHQPDIAAELLAHELTSAPDSAALHCEIILNQEFSVQSLILMNKFISACENKRLKIPDEFLNRFITHCMVSCEHGSGGGGGGDDHNNQLLMHRLVRMVCVFFATLLRLKSVDIKPRLNEMQNFATLFSSLREASNLYQSILQAK